MKNSEIKITLLGDCMSNMTQIPILKEMGYDKVIELVKDDFKDSDLLILNLETPVSRDAKKWSSEQYSFCAPAEFAETLNKLNNNTVMLTSNNHCLDRGVQGLVETINVLDSLGIKHTGTQKNGNAFLIEKIKGVSLAILNYTYGTNAFSNECYLKKNQLHYVNLLQPQELSNNFYRRLVFSRFIGFRVLRKIVRKSDLFQINRQPYERESSNKKLERNYLKMVKKAKEESDVCLSCIHIGGQYNDVPSKYTERIANKSLKNGADIISVNHEHVIHPIIKMRGVVSYSLGNFIGTNGVLCEPFDKDADISMVLHLYINKDTKKIRYSFSLYKCIEFENCSRPILMCKLIDNDKELLEKYKEITKKITGRVLTPEPEHFM